MKEVSENEKSVAVVIGAAGQLGGAIVTSFAQTHDVVALRRAGLDVTDHAAVMRRVVAARPAVIVNCTAYNDVDGAEDNAATALAVNGFAVRSLARAAEAAEAILVHYSTDFVFDGETDRPYTETDAPSPQSVYAQSKLVGEWMAASTPRHYILRVESLFGGAQARSSVDRIIESLRAGREARVFYDREVSPSFVEDVVDATRALLEHRAPPGLYHCVNSGHTNWLALAQEIARQIGARDVNLMPISVTDVVLRASRPQYAALDNSKLAHAGVVMPAWQDALARYLASCS